MSIKLSVNKKTKQPSVVYKPELDDNTAKDAFNVFINTMPQALMDIITHLYPMLRPATEVERDAHVYVFLDGEKGELENKLYKAKKYCYDVLSQTFSATLTALFPDVEYIMGCSEYQQNYVLDHTKEECDEYTAKIKEVADYVRSNIGTIIKDMLMELANETNKMDQKDQEPVQ